MNRLSMLKASAAFLAVAALSGCGDEYGGAALNQKHFTPISPAMMAKISEIGASKNSPILIRAYKQESELEVWKQDSAGEYKLLKTFPMCRWSGQLGPKKKEGDRQVPEGFYSITPGAMNPNSSFYLSFNVGYPNAYDKAHGRTGALIMVHGACSSMGCYSMTDGQIAEIYALTREAFAGGQKAVQMQSYPFRYTPQNLAKFRADPNMPFWKMLKEGNDSFEVTKRETRVSVCNAKYVFNRSGEACAPDAASPVVQAVAAKARADEQKVAELAPSTPAVRRVYSDGDQHPKFKTTQYADASADGRIIAVGGVSAVAGVSRPEALAAGPVEVAAGEPAAAAPKLANASPRPGARTAVQAAADKSAAEKAVAAKPASPTPVEAGAAFAATAQQQAATPSFFRNWLGGDAKAEAPAAVVEAAKPVALPPAKAATPAKSGPQPAAKQTKAPAKAADKTADAGPAAAPAEETSALKNMMALLPGWR